MREDLQKEQYLPYSLISSHLLKHPTNSHRISLWGVSLAEVIVICLKPSIRKKTQHLVSQQLQIAHELMRTKYVCSHAVTTVHLSYVFQKVGLVVSQWWLSAHLRKY